MVIFRVVGGYDDIDDGVSVVVGDGEQMRMVLVGVWR